MSAPTFVDLQGFVVGNQFIVKEVAILENGSVLSHYIFTSPMPWHLLTRSDKSKARWLMANHHGLRWYDGIIPYNKAKRLITEAVASEINSDHLSRLVYVKGCEKREWLANLLEDNAVARSNLIIEPAEVYYEDIPSLENLDEVNILRCNKHTKHCALQNVLKLFKWWSQHQRKLRNF